MGLGFGWVGTMDFRRGEGREDLGLRFGFGFGFCGVDGLEMVCVRLVRLLVSSISR